MPEAVPKRRTPPSFTDPAPPVALGLVGVVPFPQATVTSATASTPAAMRHLFVMPFPLRLPRSFPNVDSPCSLVLRRRAQCRLVDAERASVGVQRGRHTQRERGVVF